MTREPAGKRLSLASSYAAGQTFGFLGLFVGPVVVAMVLAIGRMLSQEIVASSAADTISIT